MDDDRAGMLALALSRHREGRHAEAAALCRAVLAADGSEAAALYLLGLACFAAEDGEAAIGAMRQLVALRPGNALGQAALARMLTAAGRHGEAVGPWRMAAGLVPEDAEIAAGLANAERAAGDVRAAIATARAALARMPKAPALRAALGWALIAAGKNDAAVAALAEEPGGEASAEISFLRGTARKALGDLEGAAEDFREAVAADPAHAAAHLGLGNALATLGRLEAARASLERAAALDPGRAEAAASLGAVLLRMGEEAAAEAALRRGLAIDPEMVAAHRNLAAICEARGRAAEARAHRDAAYRRQRVFVAPGAQPGARPGPCVLLLATAGGGNVPTQFLLPQARYTKVTWVIEYAAAGEAATLPPHDFVFNGMGDADAAGPAEAAAVHFLSGCRVPVLNAPERVAQTRRDRLPALLGGIAGLAVPAVRRAEAGADAATDAGLGFPLLVRRAGAHGGAGVRLVGSAAAMGAIPDEGPLYLTQYWPFRSADGFFRKYRMIFVDRRPLPYHLAIGTGWLVHHATTGMEADAARRAEEAHFLATPERAIGARAMEGVRAIGEALDLDFAGIDFSVLPDGRALVFEANATMLVHPEEEDGPFAYRNEAVLRILAAFEEMLGRRLGHQSLS